MPILIPTYERWMNETNPTMSFGVRGNELRAVDNALKAFWADMSTLHLEILKSALLAYEEKKNHFEIGADGKEHATRNWRSDIRNRKGVVSLLHDSLFQERKPLTEEDKEGLELIRAASISPVKDLLSGKQIQVKKTAIASLIQSAYSESKEIVTELSTIPLPKIDPFQLMRIFIGWIKYKLPSYDIDLHLPNLLAWFKGINFEIPSINFLELLVEWLKIHMPDLSVHLPDILAYFKFKFPTLNFDFLPHLHITLPSLPSITLDLPSIRIPDLDILLPSIPSIELNLREIFGVDFRILEHFPDLLNGFLESLHDIYLEAVPFLGPAKSAGKAFVGYAEAVLARYNEYSLRQEGENLFSSNGASDAFEAVLDVIVRQANRTAAGATVDLVTAGAQTGGIFLDGGTATGLAIAAGNRLAKFIIKIQIFINDYKEMEKANTILADWSKSNSSSVLDLFKACPLLGCFVIHCCEISALLSGVLENFGEAGFVAEIDSQVKKARALKETAYGFITASKFEIPNLPFLARAEADPVASLNAVKNAYAFKLKGKAKSWGFI